MTPFYDTHAHLDYPEFAPELPQLIERARVAGITRILCVGTDLDSSARVVRLAEQFDALFAVVGWHPSYVERAPEDVRPALRQLARHPKVVAIGETGLDYHRLPSQQAGKSAADDEQYKTRQARLFAQQLEVAAEAGLPCVIHERDAFEDAVTLMERSQGRPRGVFHCFARDAAAVQRVLALDCLVSFTGILTFKNGQNVRDALAAIPPGRFMLETDCPYLAPVPYRGQRCEPAHVREIAACAARVRGCSMEELSAMTCEAAHRLFPRLPPPG
ncbi:MAG TPA: TatD family hydrolase [Methylomirabilota bacterium]|nr:TatD family hydrolase [Methylomirabilota bacterium]